MELLMETEVTDADDDVLTVVYIESALYCGSHEFLEYQRECIGICIANGYSPVNCDMMYRELPSKTKDGVIVPLSACVKGCKDAIREKSDMIFVFIDKGFNSSMRDVYMKYKDTKAVLAVIYPIKTTHLSLLHTLLCEGDEAISVYDLSPGNSPLKVKTYTMPGSSKESVQSESDPHKLS